MIHNLHQRLKTEDIYNILNAKPVTRQDYIEKFEAAYNFGPPSFPPQVFIELTSICNAVNYAISDIDDAKVFINNDELSSTAHIFKTSSNHCEYVLTKTLDSLYKHHKIDLIKMDIEGFELDPLKGAKELIRTQKPTLILSAYHKNRDIYELIDFVSTLCNNYELYCYHHPQTLHEIEYYFVNKKLKKDTY